MGRRDATLTGTIKSTIADKGFGFILVDGGSEEYFFHHSAVVPPLKFEQLQKGSRVQFIAGSGQKGPRAESVSAL